MDASSTDTIQTPPLTTVAGSGSEKDSILSVLLSISASDERETRERARLERVAVASINTAFSCKWLI